MVIKFTCPNGHPLSAPENLAGKAGKCPKCATPFVVPAAEPALQNGDSGASEVTSSSATAPTAGIGTGSSKSGIKTGELFVFLCPNGHKLNGPPSLKGKAGQCPHCGAKFRVPSDEDVAEDEAAADELVVEPARGGSALATNFAELFGGSSTQADDPGMTDDDEGSVMPVPPDVHALGYIVGRLWDRRTEATEIEVFLQEGEIMSPDFYSEVLSTAEYGVFASLEGDDQYAITVIPWASVRRVGMRKVEQLSPNVFR